MQAFFANRRMWSVTIVGVVFSALSVVISAVGIRVLTIAPGLIATPIYDLAPPGLKEALGQTTVFPKRLGKAEEFAHLAEALAENTYMNGEVVRMDAAIRMSPK